ncbi:MAG: hypothetical protein QOF18_1894 [Frankiaceae bacterium]|nr:hypothetical protein [Frankiaceae bacterium]
MLVGSLRFRLPCILLAVCALVVLNAGSARAGSATRAAFVSDTNHARDYHDRREYRVRDGLNDVAQNWADWMAAHHSLEHNPNLESQVHGWQSLGENVGRGGSESAIQRAFMRSAPHRDNILSRSFTLVGVGTARDSNGVLYVDEVFKRPS